ncbi:serine/arginine repetitive matrix protein 1-like [Panicum virgatum]|uniref:serine/arginine repetitive matrix protein 1-like n=1 Tax=Panicum virgatum TaxID=38727 RepID=UPI0019D50BBB|nr:serine/arginine repetitive matrix protein 1-like [Panicum virgatum]
MPFALLPRRRSPSSAPCPPPPPPVGHRASPSLPTSRPLPSVPPRRWRGIRPQASRRRICPAPPSGAVVRRGPCPLAPPAPSPSPPVSALVDPGVQVVDLSGGVEEEAREQRIQQSALASGTAAAVLPG